MFRFSYYLQFNKKKPTIDVLWTTFVQARREKTQNEIGLEFLTNNKVEKKGKAEISAKNDNLLLKLKGDLFEELFLQDQCDSLAVVSEERRKKK
jgi:hypothetical protein